MDIIIFFSVLASPVVCFISVIYSFQKKYRRWWASWVSSLLILHAYHIMYFDGVLADATGGVGGQSNEYVGIIILIAYLLLMSQVLKNKSC